MKIILPVAITKSNEKCPLSLPIMIKNNFATLVIILIYLTTVLLSRGWMPETSWSFQVLKNFTLMRVSFIIVIIIMIGYLSFACFFHLSNNLFIRRIQ